MSERPTSVEEWEAAVRGMVGDYRAAAKFGHKSDEELSLLTRTADRLATLLPPAKERVPWWEAKGRRVDGFEVVQVENGHRGPLVWYMRAPGDPASASVDPHGMVEVDAR